MAETEVLGVKENIYKASKNEERVISFKLNDELIGIDIKKIIKITKKLDITPVPKTKDYILGVINLRGNIVPVVDLKKMLDLPNKDKEQNFILVIDSDLGNIGLMVDEIEGANTIDPEEIQPTPINSIGIDSKFISGVVMAKNEENGEKNLLILLDIDKLFENEEKNPEEN
ncbi:chemotaxis protein CheW [Nitrosophilus kaiyonis]|uniref:chemotaxis protein CheW n=1 Tax=Nitrosophilus kaiyonis TaxID=2930200 RepID=UPI0024932B35|nr:chemotaxis protein CheW [Nitrosophilus kaiyonis]